MAMTEETGPAKDLIANPRGLPLQSAVNINPADNFTGYRSFKAGSFEFTRDEYSHFEIAAFYNSGW